jgi:hypothetical protein
MVTEKIRIIIDPSTQAALTDPVPKQATVDVHGRHFGPHALHRALGQINRLRMVGDTIGAITWALIADAIIELTRDRRHDEPLN